MVPKSTSDSPASRHLLRLDDLSAADLDAVLERALASKGTVPDRTRLAGRTLGLLFFRGSLRTRVSVAAAMNQLGGNAIELTAQSDAWQLEEREGSRMDGRAPEHVKDAARVLSSYVDALAVRPAPEGQSWSNDRADREIQAWARWATVPVVNMESSLWHPLQALADQLTLREKLGDLAGKKLCLTWVHSPRPATVAVAHSVVAMAAAQGMQVTVAHPSGFELDGPVMEAAAETARGRGGSVETTHDMASGVEGAHVVYARSWHSLESYGNPTLAASRRSRAGDWRVDAKAMELTDQAWFMHAMPVRRNLEVSDEVLDGERSLVYTQAENRLHSQRALFEHLLS